MLRNSAGGNNKHSRRNAGQFFVAGELCRRGYSVVLTLGNTPNTDILCRNLAGTKLVNIQVKTFIPGRRTCSVGLKSEIDFGLSFFWILAGIPEPDTVANFQYYIIPSSVMAKKVAEAHKLWLSLPGVNGREHKDSNVRTVYLPPYRPLYGGIDLDEYHERWDLIQEKLDG